MSDVQHKKSENSDPHLEMPGAGAWTFKSDAVAGDFDRHVREQLPWYDIATGIVTHVARHYVPEGGTVVDVGASTGNVGRAVAAILDQRKARLVAIDNSPEMVARYAAPGEAIVADVRSYPIAALKPDLIVAFLVLMFIPVSERAAVVARLIDALRPGGAILVFDKLGTQAGHVGSVIYRLTLAAKYEAGAKPDEIICKELSLAGIQRPIIEAELPGFVPVFRFGDFAGFLYEKPAV